VVEFEEMRDNNSSSFLDMFNSITKCEKEFEALRGSCEANSEYCKGLFYDHADEVSKLKIDHEDVTEELSTNLHKQEDKFKAMRNKLISKEIFSPGPTMRKEEYDASL